MTASADPSSGATAPGADGRPRSVAVAIAMTGYLILLGLVGVAMSVHDVAENGIWSDHGIATALHLPGRAVSVLTSAFMPLVGVSMLRGLLRRDAKVRFAAFAFGLVMAILLGAIALAALVLVLVKEPRDALYVAAAIVLLVVPFVALAASLSRPSALEWFGSPPAS